MGSLNAEIRDDHHDPKQSEWSYPRRDERQKAQRGGGNGRSGPHDPMRAQHGDEEDIAATSAIVPISTNECPESKQGERGPVEGAQPRRISRAASAPG
jgi:hypothetical protein